MYTLNNQRLSYIPSNARTHRGETWFNLINKHLNTLYTIPRAPFDTTQSQC